ncbi:MAG TPA: hypothetical protein DIT62_03480 [Alphaproteobacteria bacterium]|nr:hypothetical protein [Alphaproteobacteria bacterium]|tara:strand:+ start:255 stop:695 length:441 start_codon:yes stop_codon:yes gene_type:complete
MDAIQIYWNNSVDFAHFVWAYMQKGSLDLLEGNINQDTIGVLLVLGGILLVLLLIIISMFKRSKPVERPVDMMASLTMQSVINSAPTDVSAYGSEDGAGTGEPDLKTIEADMKAVKELYTAGRINADLYISESRNLYEAAKALYSR